MATKPTVELLTAEFYRAQVGKKGFITGQVVEVGEEQLLEIGGGRLLRHQALFCVFPCGDTVNVRWDKKDQAFKADNFSHQPQRRGRWP